MTPESTVKKLLIICALISLTSYTAVADAQATQPLTRAQVKQELVELEQAGYDPGGNPLDYPANLQVARERVEAEHMARANDQEQTASAAVKGQASS
jgi:energy-converting hydrogenase Eha subunit F